MNLHCSLPQNCSQVHYQELQKFSRQTAESYPIINKYVLSIHTKFSVLYILILCSGSLTSSQISHWLQLIPPRLLISARRSLWGSVCGRTVYMSTCHTRMVFTRICRTYEGQAFASCKCLYYFTPHRYIMLSRCTNVHRYMKQHSHQTIAWHTLANL